MLASGSYDKSIKLWDVRATKSQCVTSLVGHTGWITALCYMPDHDILLSGDKDGLLKATDMRMMKAVTTVQHLNYPIKALKYMKSINSIVFG